MKAVQQSSLSTGALAKVCLKKMKNRDYGVINFVGTLSLLLHFLSCVGTKSFILMSKSEGWHIAAA